MGDMMNFPKRWEDFLHDYEFEDDRRIYTNGSRLIPSFRVKQMMEHYAPVRHGWWIDKGEYAVCTECGGMIQELLGGFDCNKAVSSGYEWTLKDGRVVELRVTIKQPPKGE